MAIVSDSLDYGKEVERRTDLGIARKDEAMLEEKRRY